GRWAGRSRDGTTRPRLCRLRHGRNTFLLWLRAFVFGFLIESGGFGFYQQQRVVKLNGFAVAKLEAVEFPIVLAVGGSKKILACSTGADRVRENVSVLGTRQGGGKERILEESGGACCVLPFLPVNFFQFRPKMYRRPRADNKLVVRTDPLDFTARGSTCGIEGKHFDVLLGIGRSLLHRAEKPFVAF